jgi:hypothetical protein
MLATEKAGILAALQAGHEALDEALVDVDEATARRKPASGGWSILECVEHIAVSEQYLLSRLQAGAQSDNLHGDPEREALVSAIAADRSRHMEAPHPVHPAGRFSTLAEAVAAFAAARSEVVRWVEECDENPRTLATDHPFIPPPVNCYEILLATAAHPKRHAEQIVQIRGALEPGTKTQ